MHVICTDGTTIQCQDFEAIDSGVLFYQETPGRRGTEGDREDAEDAESDSASGFVPITELRFVLPDEMIQQMGGQSAAAPQPAPRGGPGDMPRSPPQQQGRAHTQPQGRQSQPMGRPPESGGR